MKYSRLISHTCTRFILAFLTAAPALTNGETLQELNTWSYHKEWDKINNLNYSLVRSPLPKRGLYDNLRLELVCKDNKLQFGVDANSLITSQGRTFEFEYQVDKQNPVIIEMKTYPDTKRRGYTDKQVEKVANDILSGQSIFIRIHTLIKTVLSGAIPLDDASQPVQRVLADCGILLPDNKEETLPVYSLDDFERDFKSLSEEQKRHMLAEIKKILERMR